jgi:hypothetical protein
MNTIAVLGITFYAIVAAQTLPAIDAVITPPARDYNSFVSFRASGTQNYTCPNSTWVLLTPDAKLFNTNNAIIANHSAGPTWQSTTDGSLVVGQLLNSTGTIHGGSNIPWLLLAAKSTSGRGIFSNVKYIVRYNTVGGVAPNTSCATNSAVSVAYTADYAFYSVGNSTGSGNGASFASISVLSVIIALIAIII